jgi:hypothetical protein
MRVCERHTHDEKVDHYDPMGHRSTCYPILVWDSRQRI